MENNNNKGVFVLLIVIIVILTTLCVLFATGMIGFNSNKEDNNDSEQNITENDADKIDDNIINKLIGSYEYKGEYVDEYESFENYDFGIDAWKNGGMQYEYLKLTDSGYAEANSKVCGGGGYGAKGKWYVSDNEIIVVNEECKAIVNNGEVVYPNCQPIWTYIYKVENEKILINTSSSFDSGFNLNKIN